MLIRFSPTWLSWIIFGDQRVEGVVLSLSEASVLLDLDELEEYDPQGRVEENVYTRHLSQPTPRWCSRSFSLGLFYDP